MEGGPFALQFTGSDGRGKLGSGHGKAPSGGSSTARGASLYASSGAALMRRIPRRRVSGAGAEGGGGVEVVDVDGSAHPDFHHASPSELVRRRNDGHRRLKLSAAQVGVFERGSGCAL